MAKSNLQLKTMPPRRGLRYVFALAAVIVGWIGTLAFVMFLGGTSPGALVILPSAQVVERLPEGFAITGSNRLALVVLGEGSVAAQLYERGAWLVLPAGLAGCLGIFASKPDRDA